MICRNAVTCALSLMLSLRVSSAQELKFPPGFKFGAATAAYQVEGAWNISDKGENIWDHFTHTNPRVILDRSNGDIACDSYHHWIEDIRMVKNLGLHFYRFSISWSRLLPSGFNNHISKDGFHYYNKLIDELLRNGIEPVVTLYHFDLPQTLQNLGGWANPLITDWYANYAEVVFDLFADRVQMWITFNEPVAICAVNYNEGAFAPGVIELERGDFLCSKNILIAHAKAWRIYNRKFKLKFKGKVSIANQLLWYQADTVENEETAEAANQYAIGRYTHPVYSKDGGWPPVIEDAIGRNSKAQGFRESKLPAFTKEEIELVKGTYDFVAFNYYTSRIARKGNPGEKFNTFFTGTDIPELGIKSEIHPDWTFNHIEFFAAYPEGLRKVMNWMIKQYGDLDFFVTENGYCDVGQSLDDDERILYIKRHLEQMLLAINEDGIKVTGYTYWALMDNFEWADGYTTKFGLYEVDFTDPQRKRTPRKSASYYSGIIKEHSLNVSVHPESWLRLKERRKKNYDNKGIELIPHKIVILSIIVWYIKFS